MKTESQTRAERQRTNNNERMTIIPKDLKS